MDDVRSLILATVIGVNRGPISYPSCSACHTKVQEGESTSEIRSFACSRCKKSIPESSINNRYRLSLVITEGGMECDVTIFGSCLDRVLGASADKFMQFQDNLHQNGFSSDQVQNLIHEVFNNCLVGQKFYFGFRIPKTSKGRTLKYVMETVKSCGIVAHQIVTIETPAVTAYETVKREAERIWRKQLTASVLQDEGPRTQTLRKDDGHDNDYSQSQNTVDNRSAFDFSHMSSINYSNQQLSLGLMSLEASVLSQEGTSYNKSTGSDGCENFSESLFDSQESQLPVPCILGVKKSKDTRRSSEFLVPPVDWRSRTSTHSQEYKSASLFSKDSHTSSTTRNVTNVGIGNKRQSNVWPPGRRSLRPRVSFVSRASTMSDVPSEILNETFSCPTTKTSSGLGCEEKIISNEKPLRQSPPKESESSKPSVENFSESIFSQETQGCINEEIPHSGVDTCKPDSVYTEACKEIAVPAICPKLQGLVEVKLKHKSIHVNPDTFSMWDLLPHCGEYVVMSDDEDEPAHHQPNRFSGSGAVQNAQLPESENLDEFLNKCDDGVSDICDSSYEDSKLLQEVFAIENVIAHKDSPTCTDRVNDPRTEFFKSEQNKMDPNDTFTDKGTSKNSPLGSKTLNSQCGLEAKEVRPEDQTFPQNSASTCKEGVLLQKSLEVISKEVENSFWDCSADLFTQTQKSFYRAHIESFGKTGAGNENGDVEPCSRGSGVGETAEAVQTDSGIGSGVGSQQDKLKAGGECSNNEILCARTVSHDPSGHKISYSTTEKHQVQLVEESQDLWSQDLFASQCDDICFEKVDENTGIQKGNGEKLGKVNSQNSDHQVVALTLTNDGKREDNDHPCGSLDQKSRKVVFKTPTCNSAVRSRRNRKSRCGLNRTSTPLSLQNTSIHQSSRIERTPKSTDSRAKLRIPQRVLCSVENSLHKRPNSCLKGKNHRSRLPSSFLRKGFRQHIPEHDKDNLQLESRLSSVKKTVRFDEKSLYEEKENVLSDSVVLAAAEIFHEVNLNSNQPSLKETTENIHIYAENRNTSLGDNFYSPTPDTRHNNPCDYYSPDLFSSMDESNFEIDRTHERDYSPFQSSRSRLGSNSPRESSHGDEAIPTLSFDVSADLFSD